MFSIQIICIFKGKMFSMELLRNRTTMPQLKKRSSKIRDIASYLLQSVNIVELHLILSYSGMINAFKGPLISNMILPRQFNILLHWIFFTTSSSCSIVICSQMYENTEVQCFSFFSAENKLPIKISLIISDQVAKGR